MYRNYNDYDNNYGARMRDSRGRFMEGDYGRRYRGDDMIDDMYREYRNYEEGRNMYGTDQETIKSLEYMLKLDKKFIKMLEEDAQTPEEKEMIRRHKMEMANM